MPTTSARRARPGRIRVYWSNPPGPEAVLVSEHRGRRRERTVRARSRLTLAEAAAVLDRRPADVRRAIRTGFLAARGVGGAPVITLGACWRYIAEVRRDLVDARAARREPLVPADLVHARRP